MRFFSEGVARVTTAPTRRRTLTALLAFLALAGLVLAVFWRGTALSVTPVTLLATLEGDLSPVVIDVRTRAEFRSGHIPGSLNIPLHVVLTRYDDLALARDRPLVVYCGTGPRACIASFVLQMVGFDQVYVLEGQLKGWVGAGHPLAL